MSLPVHTIHGPLEWRDGLLDGEKYLPHWIRKSIQRKHQVMYVIRPTRRIMMIKTSPAEALFGQAIHTILSKPEKGAGVKLKEQNRVKVLLRDEYTEHIEDANSWT